jgi:phospholipase/lecithinase/hemolysin
VTPLAPPFDCKEPDEYLFWDGIHPTKATHAAIAQDIAGLLSQ